MDPWAWSVLADWTAERTAFPPGPLFCVIEGPTRRRAWCATAVRAELRHLAAEAGVRRRFAPHQLRHAHAVELLHEGIPLPLIQRQLGARVPINHGHLPGGNLLGGDHRRDPRPESTDDARQHGP